MAGNTSKPLSGTRGFSASRMQKLIAEVQLLDDIGDPKMDRDTAIRRFDMLRLLAIGKGQYKVAISALKAACQVAGIGVIQESAIPVSMSPEQMIEEMQRDARDIGLCLTRLSAPVGRDAAEAAPTGGEAAQDGLDEVPTLQ
jgi:hypothetical protein